MQNMKNFGTRNRMRADRKYRWWAALLALTVCSAQGQTLPAAEHGPRLLISSSGPTTSAVPGQLVREIDDPYSGARWLLLRDESHPGGPGLLVLAGGMGKELPGRSRSRDAQDQQETALLPFVIHAGDRLIVEESSLVVEARLEAVALGPAAAGSPLLARLKIGGKVVHALALAPGRAALQAETGVRP